jgi:hypothetical protein
MKRFLLILLIAGLVSCGNNNAKQISDYKDSIRANAELQKAIVDSPYPDTDTGALRRSLELQKLKLQRSVFEEKIRELEKK